jgi:hypothetical protein
MHIETMRPAALALPLAALAVASVAVAGPPVWTDCILSWPEARMQAYGYNHIVHVKDVCDLGADCVVTTDVNPEPTKVSVGPKSETEVNTWLGSPARVFTPKVVCTLRPR